MTKKEIIKKLNKEYPKFLKKINNKKLTQKKEAEEFTKWLEDLAQNTPNDKQFK